MGQIANRQSLAFSERSQLSQAIPQFHVEQMLNEWTPIARFESQHNERRDNEDKFLCFRRRYERQWTLAIRIAAITLASASAITIARFRPSKAPTVSKKASPFFQGPKMLPFGWGAKNYVKKQCAFSVPGYKPGCTRRGLYSPKGRVSAF